MVQYGLLLKISAIHDSRQTAMLQKKKKKKKKKKKTVRLLLSDRDHEARRSVCDTMSKDIPTRVQIGRQACRQTNRQRHGDRQIDRQTDRQTAKQRQTNRQTCARAHTHRAPPQTPSLSSTSCGCRKPAASQARITALPRLLHAVTFHLVQWDLGFKIQVLGLPVSLLPAFAAFAWAAQ